jgi:hypothetical protein
VEGVVTASGEVIMKFELEIGDKEKSKMEFVRNWFTGSMKVRIDGRRVVLQSPLSLTTHFTLKLKRHYEFEIGKTEKHMIVLEKERPALLAGVRPQTYRVFVDSQLFYEQSGY